MPHHLTQKKKTAHKTRVFRAAPFGTKKKRFKKREFFVPDHFAEKNGSKNVSFPCRTIWHNKKRFKKREFFVPHHLAEQNGSKNVSFSCRTIFKGKNGSKNVSFSCRTKFGRRKRLKKREFFAQRHLAPKSVKTRAKNGL